MSLKLQKVIVFVPVLNIIVGVFWFISRIKSKKPFPYVIVLPVIAIGACLLGSFIRMVVDLLGASTIVYDVVTYSTLYVQCVIGPFCMLMDEISLEGKTHQTEK